MQNKEETENNNNHNNKNNIIINRLDLNKVLQQQSSFPTQSPKQQQQSSSNHRFQISNSPSNYQKVFSTFQKPDYIFVNHSKTELDCTFSPRILQKKTSSAILFYQDQIRIKVNQCNFSDFLKWFGDYDKIEMDQSIIQYLLPSLQGAQGDIDSDIFRNSIDLGKKIVEVYKLILDYYGIELQNELDGELVLKQNWKDRFEQTFFKKVNKSVHGYRLKRMLNFLSKTGFLKYCHKFLEFMKKQIKGNEELIKKASIGSPCRIPTKDVPLPILSYYNDVFDSDWIKYDQLDLNNEMQQKMLKNSSVFFKSNKFNHSLLLQTLNQSNNSNS